MCRSARRALPRQRTAPSAARRASADVLDRWALTGTVDDAGLLVSELVTNALLHSDGALGLQLSASGDLVEIGVHDTNPTLTGRAGSGARPGLDRADGEHFGRGLLIVDALAEVWGTLAEGDAAGAGEGKCVWCALTAAPTAWNPTGRCPCPSGQDRTPSGQPLTHVPGPWD